MSSSDKRATPVPTTQKSTDPVVLIAGEAGMPYAPSLSNASAIDPFAEWLDLMEVVYMLCPTWTVRDQPMLGEHWRL